MNINVKQTDCQFYVDEENRKVVCVIPNTSNLFFRYIDDFKLDLSAGTKFWSNLLMPSRFVGIATCSENDTFDAELGMLIAFNKAKSKLNTSFFKRAQKYVNKIDEEYTAIVENFNDFGERLSLNADRREKEINARLDGEEEEDE